jgi:catechol 2,3-dioxygenase-like lactoylglutathione lyase family enzyme
VHIIGIDPNDPQGLKDYLGDRDLASLQGTGTVDHMAFTATGLDGMRLRLKSHGVGFRERTVPSLGIHQVFFEDPSGVTIELNYPAAEAAAAA